MAALGINLGFFLFQVFNFIIVLVLLTAWAYKPLMNALENRKKKIAQSLEDARIAAEARANAEAEANKILADARSQASKEISEATSRADKAAREVMAQAEKDAAKIRSDGSVEAAAERERVLSEVRGQIASLAIAATHKLVGEALDERRQHALVDEFFSGIKAGNVVVLENASLEGGSAEVTSALTLTAEEQQKVKESILTQLGGQQATVTFRIDPSIMGGLVVKVGDKVLDGSVSGQLETLRQNLR